MNNIRLFKTISGEFVITEVEDILKNGMYILHNPAVIIPVPQQQGQIGFGKMLPFSDYSKEITMNPDSISVESEPTHQMKEAYESFITQLRAQESGIIMPSTRLPRTSPTTPGDDKFSKLNM